MAKSIRSKWKRKCRAIKRVRYGKKELERLKKTLGIDDANQNNLDVVMESVSEIAEVKDAKQIQEDKSEDSQDKTEEEEEEENEPEHNIEMEVDGKKRIFNSKTYKDQNGAYPVWLHPRKMQKKSKKKKAKKVKRLKNKETKKSS